MTDMKIVISGYGKMGHMVEDVLKRKENVSVLATEDVCSVDPTVARDSVCIDFTTPDAFRANYSFIARHFKAAVIGTTGWNDIAPDVIAEFTGCGTPMIYSSNFSIGVNATFAALEKISAILKQAETYVPHIEETHHIHKLDAPSGTARTMAELVEAGMGIKPEISSFRVGEVPGIHVVEFKSGVDRINITHEAFSRQGFAEGAVLAAYMTEGLEGVHTFKDLILK